MTGRPCEVGLVDGMVGPGQSPNSIEIRHPSTQACSAAPLGLHFISPLPQSERPSLPRHECPLEASNSLPKSTVPVHNLVDL